MGKIAGAFLTGKTWNIPEDAQKPDRANKKVALPTTLLEVLSAERRAKLPGGIYHKVQIELTYNSNHIEGSRLTHDQTRYIFETNTIGIDGGTVKVDDIVETANHFKCIDMIIENAKKPITETFIKVPVKIGLLSAIINGCRIPLGICLRRNPKKSPEK